MNYNTPLVFLFFLTGRRPHHHTTTMPMPMRIFISSCTRTSTCTVQCLHHPSTAGRSSTLHTDPTPVWFFPGMLCSCTTPSVPSSDTTNHAHTTTNEATDGPQTGNATTTGDNNPDTRPRPTTQRRRGTTTQTLVHGQRRRDITTQTLFYK